MFFGILSTILRSFSTIFWKKALNFNLNFSVSPRIFSLLAGIGPLVIIPYLVITLKYDFTGVNFINLLLIILIVILSFLGVQIGQYVYKHEKISVLTPYENLNKVLSIILAFFIFSDVSLISFFLTLTAGIIIIFASIDFKKLKIPKLIKLFSINQIVQSIIILLIGYVLINITSVDYYIIQSFLYITFIFFIVVYKKELNQLQKLPKGFYIFRGGAAIFGNSSVLINLIIISSFGITISILFSYFYIGFIMILSFIFFGDKPSKKNILLTVILAILVGLGYYFR